MVVATYPSSTEPGVTHTVTVKTRPGTAQVALKCTCKGFTRAARWHSCWHVREVAQRNNYLTVVGGELFGYTPEAK